MIKIWHISDTHSFHDLLEVPEVDLVIHSGDFTNYKDVYKNESEAHSFLQWYSLLDIPNKILIAGNHDALAFKWGEKFRKLCKELGIIYLENDWTEVGGYKIWGSPFSPRFGDWYFMKNRSKLDAIWRNIPLDTDIVVTHTPPKTVLDLSYDRFHTLEFCGCSALLKNLLKIEPMLSCFGHIHNNKDIINAGTKKLSKYKTIFSNGSVVTDGKFGKLSSNGNIIELNKNVQNKKI